MQAIHKEGFKIVLISNQALIKSALTGKAATNAKAKFDSVLEAAGVPATVLIATQKDGNRKPETGMWDFFTENCNGGVKVDKSQSYYVGDAAGRKYDFSDSDKVFAESVGLSFKVPEDVFGEGALLIHPGGDFSPRVWTSLHIMQVHNASLSLEMACKQYSHLLYQHSQAAHLQPGLRFEPQYLQLHINLQ